jgi:hypothetical protein
MDLHALKNYKECWICFQCRKSFKKTNFEDFLEQNGKTEVYRKLIRCRGKKARNLAEKKYGVTTNELEADYYSKVSKCPGCGDILIIVEMDFKTPKQSDKKTWARLKRIYGKPTNLQTFRKFPKRDRLKGLKVLNDMRPGSAKLKNS